MNRGDFVTVAAQGDFGKPRPALVIQADAFADHSTVTVMLLSSTLVDAPLLRLNIEPSKNNGLSKPSQIAVDRVYTGRREQFGPVIGHMTMPPCLRSRAPSPRSSASRIKKGLPPFSSGRPFHELRTLQDAGAICRQN
jgi:mRNA interferase MazF